ncbi:hypothetical protein BC828DRAFT_304230 [Blastocladiella britannica]|nr:hypothetical protein BC828DRAFT_304230 [Blastocladiella britannica]
MEPTSDQSRCCHYFWEIIKVGKCAKRAESWLVRQPVPCFGMRAGRRDRGSKRAFGLAVARQMIKVHSRVPHISPLLLDPSARRRCRRRRSTAPPAPCPFLVSSLASFICTARPLCLAMAAALASSTPAVPLNEAQSLQEEQEQRQRQQQLLASSARRRLSFLLSASTASSPHHRLRPALSDDEDDQDGGDHSDAEIADHVGATTAIDPRPMPSSSSPPPAKRARFESPAMSTISTRNERNGHGVLSPSSSSTSSFDATAAADERELRRSSRKRPRASLSSSQAGSAVSSRAPSPTPSNSSSSSSSSALGAAVGAASSGLEQPRAAATTASALPTAAAAPARPGNAVVSAADSERPFVCDRCSRGFT